MFLFLFSAHASCVFNGYIWVIGGRTVPYAMYNLVSSVKTADVWKSEDGGKKQELDEYAIKNE